MTDTHNEDITDNLARHLNRQAMQENGPVINAAISYATDLNRFAGQMINAGERIRRVRDYAFQVDNSMERKLLETEEAKYAQYLLDALNHLQETVAKIRSHKPTGRR